MIAQVCWAVLALIHALPAVALFKPALITRLYGVEQGSATFVLMHHRAALFLVIVILCLWSVVRSEVRPLAGACVAVSMLSFIGIWWMAGNPASLRSIATADILGLPFLAAAVWSAIRSGS